MSLLARPSSCFKVLGTLKAGSRARWSSTFANASYQNILVETTGKNGDVALITLNRPKAVGYFYVLPSGFLDKSSNPIYLSA
jgi:hypothetical protein